MINATKHQPMLTPKTGVCACATCTAAQHQRWVQFWAIWHQEHGYTRAQARQWMGRKGDRQSASQRP